MTLQNEPQLSAEMRTKLKEKFQYWDLTSEENLDELAAFLATALEEQKQIDAKIVRNYRLCNWSGEAEVYGELEEIAKLILNGKGE